MIFEMAAALSPNIAAQIIFRFFVGVFASPPLVCGGGTISDLFNPLDKTWAFSVYAMIGFVSNFSRQCEILLTFSELGRADARPCNRLLRVYLDMAIDRLDNTHHGGNRFRHQPFLSP